MVPEEEYMMQAIDLAKKGRGFVISNENKIEEAQLGTIFTDSVFTPIKNVKYFVAPPSFCNFFMCFLYASCKDFNRVPLYFEQAGFRFWTGENRF